MEETTGSRPRSPGAHRNPTLGMYQAAQQGRFARVDPLLANLLGANRAQRATHGAASALVRPKSADESRCQSCWSTAFGGHAGAEEGSAAAPRCQHHVATGRLEMMPFESVPARRLRCVSDGCGGGHPGDAAHRVSERVEPAGAVLAFRRRPLTHLSQTRETAPDYSDLAGHRADPDLRIWMQADWLDAPH
jgi:hypothetical protein